MSNTTNRRICSLLVNSFSRLGSQPPVPRPASANRGHDSGFESSLSSHHNSSCSFSSSADQTAELEHSSSLYSSTPISSSTSSFTTPPCDTPVSGQRHQHRRQHHLSSDRIPFRPSFSHSLQEGDAAEQQQQDLISVMINRDEAEIRRIYQYLSGEDLLSFCQVNSTYCSSVFDDRHALQRLVKFLASQHENAENRSQRRNVVVNVQPRVLREIQNLLPDAAAAAVDRVEDLMQRLPSPLERADMERMPGQLKSLINRTKRLRQDERIAATCRCCRHLIVVCTAQDRRADAASSSPSECRKCQKSRRRPSSSSSSLFPVRSIHR